MSSFEVVSFNEEVLDAFDKAVERYFDHTTELFRLFHKPRFDGLRERLEQVLQGSP